ncbi:TPA: hypothetical protein ACH3X2_011740 [Trebouxia sp. C0005]
MVEVAYVYASSWKCSGSGDRTIHTFNSYDSDVLLLLPACIREQYPFQLTAQSGVASEMSDLVTSASAKGHSISGTQSTIHELHKLQFYRKELVYIDCLPRLRPEYRALPAPGRVIVDAASSNAVASGTDCSTAIAPALPAAAHVTESSNLNCTVGAATPAAAPAATASHSKGDQGLQRRSYQPMHSVAKGGLRAAQTPAAFGKFGEDQGYGGHVKGANFMAQLWDNSQSGCESNDQGNGEPMSTLTENIGCV